MRILRTVIAFIAAAIATYLAASTLYTQQTIAKQSAVGAVYTRAQSFETYLENLTGLTTYAVVLAAALLIGFIVAFGVKRILTPLAPVAYPVAGASAVLVAIVLIENQLGGGAGVIGGARDALGMGLQALAGALGGGVFALLRPRRSPS
ncbi:MAG: hypothetical protein AAGJ87_08425 [Pseudomonadota bacterium]